MWGAGLSTYITTLSRMTLYQAMRDGAFSRLHRHRLVVHDPLTMPPHDLPDATLRAEGGQCPRDVGLGQPHAMPNPQPQTRYPRSKVLIRDIPEHSWD